MEHRYNLEIAIKYGIEEAVMIAYFAYWVGENAAANRNLHDGRYWTYNKSENILKSLPEFKNKKRIEYLINKLVGHNIIMKGCYNEKVYDRTLWYTFTDDGIKLLCDNQCLSKPCLLQIVKEVSTVSSCEFQISEMSNPENEISQIPNLGNANPENETTIPNNTDYTDNKPNKKTTNNISPSIPQGDVIEEMSQEKILFEEFRKIYLGTKRGLDVEFANFCKKHKDWREVLPYLKVNYERQIEAKKSQRGSIDPRYEKHLQTYINQRCWEEEISYGSNTTTTQSAGSYDRQALREWCRSGKQLVVD